MPIKDGDDDEEIYAYHLQMLRSFNTQKRGIIQMEGPQYPGFGSPDVERCEI
jgi:hypothetical protein